VCVYLVRIHVSLGMSDLLLSRPYIARALTAGGRVGVPSSSVCHFGGWTACAALFFDDLRLGIYLV